MLTKLLLSSAPDPFHSTAKQNKENLHLPTRTLRRLWRAIQRVRTFRRCRQLPPGAKLHVACGNVHLDGWINIDKFSSPAADFIVDVRYGLPFRDLSYIFAEHFIEHLSYPEIIAFLRECRNALSPDGVLRLSTPNLDWVYRTHYRPHENEDDRPSVQDCFALNKAFHGWGHRFLFNGPSLATTLHHAGFAEVQPAAFGQSRHSALAGLEQHDASPDLPNLPALLIIEAFGSRVVDQDLLLTDPEKDYLNALSAR